MTDAEETVSSSLTQARESPRTKKETFGSFLLYVIIAIALALGIRFYIAQPYLVSGSSMEPTFDDMQYLIIDRIIYTIQEPVRGDVVVFKYPPQPTRSLIKRVIGLPGDTVKIKRGAVTIVNSEHPDGFVLDEPYLAAENRVTGDQLEVSLGEDEYFVLGDNRRVSSDSRMWGSLPREDISGRVDLRLYPFDKVALLPGEARYTE
ncbi:MAG: signal peptidase I [Patescibacteria group bacterium]|nr:signal peptidase I [Patescibacteria group bacterium]